MYARPRLRRSSRRIVTLAVSVLLFGFASCATTGSSGSGESRDIISEEELVQWGSTFSSAYQIVEQLRPQWLRQRGNVSLSPGSGPVDYIVVYEDRNRMGDPEVLRTISAQNVKEIQHYSTGEAIQFGPPDHPHGAIVVRTKSGR